MKRVSFVMMIALAIAGAPSAIAQQSQAGAATTVTQGQGSGQGSGQGQGRAPTTTVSGQGVGVSMTNVRLDLTITDQTTANASPIKKVISMLLADGGGGRVRSNGTVYPNTQTPPYQVSLNADAGIRRVEGDRIRIEVTVEYSPVGPEGAGEGRRGSPLNQTVTVVLTSGKPTVIVQAADPLTDRKVTLEATATIVR